MSSSADKKVVSEYQKMLDLLDNMELFLRPSLIDGLKHQLAKIYDEARREAAKAAYSRELQELRPLFDEYKKTLDDYYIRGTGPGPFSANIQLRDIMETIKRIYGHKKL